MFLVTEIRDRSLCGMSLHKTSNQAIKAAKELQKKEVKAFEKAHGEKAFPEMDYGTEDAGSSLWVNGDVPWDAYIQRVPFSISSLFGTAVQQEAENKIRLSVREYLVKDVTFHQDLSRKSMSMPFVSYRAVCGDMEINVDLTLDGRYIQTVDGQEKEFYSTEEEAKQHLPELRASVKLLFPESEITG